MTSFHCERARPSTARWPTTLRPGKSANRPCKLRRNAVLSHQTARPILRGRNPASGTPILGRQDLPGRPPRQPSTRQDGDSIARLAHSLCVGADDYRRPQQQGAWLQPRRRVIASHWQLDVESCSGVVGVVGGTAFLCHGCWIGEIGGTATLHRQGLRRKPFPSATYQCVVPGEDKGTVAVV